MLLTFQGSFKDYDVLFGGSVALRGSFLIDADGTVRHSVINDLPLGRNIDEMIRMVDTMIFTNEHGEVCPAGWQKGDEGMADTEGVADYLAKHESGYNKLYRQRIYSLSNFYKSFFTRLICSVIIPIIFM